MDWRGLEQVYTAEAIRALGALGERTGEHFYAVLLYGSYRELDGRVTLPQLAALSMERLREPRSGDFYGYGWSIDDAHLELLDAAVTRPLEEALTAEATRGSQGHWHKVERRLDAVLVRIVRRLRDAAPSVASTTADFVAYVLDEDGGFERAVKSIPGRLRRRLFPAQQETARRRDVLGRQPVDERARALVEALDHDDGIGSEEAANRLLELGEPSVAPLLARLRASGRRDWETARLLGMLGVPRPDVIEALRARTRSAEFPDAWFPTALGLLGDLAWLRERGGALAVVGTCARLKGIATGIPLDYRPVETLLDEGGAATRSRVERELELGRTMRQITSADVDEAIRGLESPHPVVRWHACGALWDRKLGQSKRIVPALAERLSDPYPFVRRIAAVSLMAWKRAAKPYLPRLEALRDDADETVRRVAESLLGAR